MRIIPAIDIINGHCVRLTKGDYSTSKVYSEDPIEMAKRFEDHGISWLHLVDLDGAREKTVRNLGVLEKIAGRTTLKIDFSGGIRSETDIKSAFEAGANQVACGSIAAVNRELFLDWLKTFGPEKLILGADARKRMISTVGWSEESTIDVVSYISEYSKLGVIHVICTDIEKDGMLRGPSTELYSEIIGKSDVRLIASGGISSIDDIDAVREAGCEGVIIGKAIYEGNIGLKELEKICLKEE